MSPNELITSLPFHSLYAGFTDFSIKQVDNPFLLSLQSRDRMQGFLKNRVCSSLPAT